MFVDHLQPGLHPDTVQREPTRNGYGDGLLEAARHNDQVVALAADLTESTRTLPFAEAFPQRFIQVGIAEQNMASVASGMAAMGKVPFIASYAMFSPGRSWEQVRTTIAYNNANVKIIGAHAGISVGPDGATHQAIEDLALMRVIPNMVVIAPADIHEAKQATLAAARYVGPVYLRIGRSPTPVVTTTASPFTIGVAEHMYDRTSKHAQTVGIVTTGSLLFNGLMAAQALNQQGIGASVLHCATIKPFDEERLVAFAKEHHRIVTVEEHQVAGGLGSVVSEVLGEQYPVPLYRIGVRNAFGQSGEPDELITHYGMGIEAIVKAAEGLITRFR